MPTPKAVPERKDGETRVGSIANAVAILRFLAQLDAPLGVNAIARELGLNQSSCFNILRTLVAERFVEFDPSDKRYSLGFGSIDLARRALDPANAFDIARPLLERMARRDDLTIGMWRLTHHPQRLLLVGHCESGAPMHIRLANGQRIPRLAGAMGPLVAAVLDVDRDQIAREFASLIWEVSPGIDHFLASVERAREDGWALDSGHYSRGVETLAVPVFDDGALRYVLSLTTFSGRAEAASFATPALELAQAIERRLFGPGRMHLKAVG